MANKKTSKDGISAVLSNIEKMMGNKDGKSPFSRFGDIEVDETPVIPFGIPDIDAASYCGGVPRGKIVEIFGPESSGKSLLSTYLMANAQKQQLEASLIDVEQSFDPFWAGKHGLNVKTLLYGNDFTCGEQALEYAYQMAKSGAFGIVVIDSTAALVPLAELEGTLEDNARVGAQAQLMSRGCRKIIKACGETNTTCIFINQIREKIGVMYGDPTTTPGGKALKFYAHQRIKVVKTNQIKVKDGKDEKIVGQISKVTFVKNKTARPFGQCEFRIVFDPASLNPVVMMVNALKSAQLIGTYKGIYRIKKDVLDNSDPIDTGSATINELADYCIKNELVIPLLDQLIVAKDDGDYEGDIDGAILEMKEDKSKIVSPTLDVKMDVKKINDATADEVGEDAKDDVKEEDLE